MSARGTVQTLLVVLLALVCVGFIAVVGMSAAATPGLADDGGTHGYDSTDHDRFDDRSEDRRDDRPNDSPDDRPNDSPDDRPNDSPDDRHDDRDDASRSFDEQSDDRSDPEERPRDGDGSPMHVNVHATEDVLTVTNRGEEPVNVTFDALEGSYDGVEQYRLEPDETLELPAPDEPSKIRVLAESDDARFEAVLTFEAYEYDCGQFSHSLVAPASIQVEGEAEGHSEGWRHRFDRPGFECPFDGAPGEGEPPEDLDGAYNDTHDRFWDRYEDGNEDFWTTYEAARAAAWGGYEDGSESFWDVYEQVTDAGGDDDEDGGPQDRFNETRDDVAGQANDTRDAAERVGGDVQEGAERVGEDVQDGANRVENDTRADVDRVREEAESGRERVENDANRTVEDLGPDGGDDNGSDDGSLPEGVPPEGVPPEGVPPEGGLLPEDVLPDELSPEGGSLPEDILLEDVPPGDGPPGDDNGTDEDPLPEGEAVSVDTEADAGREDDTVYADGSATVNVADGTAHARVHEYLEAEGAIGA